MASAVIPVPAVQASAPSSMEGDLNVLAAAALRGDLLFGDTHGADFIGPYSRALAALGGAVAAEQARPVASPRDLVRLLQRGGPAGELAHGMLFSLLVEGASMEPGTPRATLRSMNMTRLPIVDLSLFDALLTDFERRCTALASRLLSGSASIRVSTAAVDTSGASGASSSSGAGAVPASPLTPGSSLSVAAAADASATAAASSGDAEARAAATALGRTAKMVWASHAFYSGRFLGPAVRAFGFERFHRAITLALRGAFAAMPTAAIDLHLRILQMWAHGHSSVFYQWNESPEFGSVSPVQVADEWLRSVPGVAAALVDAVLPLANCEEAPVLKHDAWAGSLGAICDIQSTAEAFAAGGGLPPLLREVTDSARKGAITNLLISLANAARFPAAAAKAMECNAAGLLMPLVYHDEPRMAFLACHAIALLGNHQELLGAVEATGVLTDMLAVLRSLVHVRRPALGFAEPDVAATLQLARRDNPLSLRLCGALQLADYAHGALQSPEAQALLRRAGAVDAARECCLDADAFLYTVGTSILSALALPLPYYRDPARGGAGSDGSGAGAGGSGGSGSGGAEAAVLAWNIDEVCAWVGRQPFRQYRSHFRDSLVDGTMLATMTDEELGAMGIGSPLHRKAIRSAIGRLLYAAGIAYPHAVVPGALLDGGYGAAAGGGSGTPGVDAAGGDGLSSSGLAIGPPGSPPLLRTLSGSGVALGSPAFLAAAARAGMAGGMMLGGAVGGGVGGAGGGGDGGEPDCIDVFISYRRKTGAVLAQLLNVHLKAAGKRAFLDVENLGTGAFDEALKRQLTASKNVVVVLSEGALDRCMVSCSFPRNAACVSCTRRLPSAVPQLRLLLFDSDSELHDSTIRE